MQYKNVARGCHPAIYGFHPQSGWGRLNDFLLKRATGAARERGYVIKHSMAGKPIFKPTLDIKHEGPALF